MTFIEEELETLEQSPDYRRFLKVYIKYQMFTLCQKLADVGEESFVVTASAADGTFSHVGSSGGDNFLGKCNEIKWKFLSFCSSSAHIPGSYESRPESGDSNLMTAHSDAQGITIEDNSETSQMAESVEENVEYTEPQTEHAEYTEAVDDSSSVHTVSSGNFPMPSLFNGTQIKTEDIEEYSSTVLGNFCIYDSHEKSTSEIENSYDEKGHNEKIMISGACIKREPEEFHTTQKSHTLQISNFLKSEMEFGFSPVSSIVNESISLPNVADVVYRKDDAPMERSLPLVTRSHYCKSCDREFSSRNLYNVHMRSHMEDRPYQCQFCPKSFAKASHLKMHMATHTGEKPYQCLVCKKTFLKLFNFKLHINTHTGERPYQCQICSKTFTQPSNLKTHMRSHTGERPYQCRVCHKAFAKSQTLSHHTKTNHT